MTRRWVAKIAATAGLALFLAGCAASFEHSIKEEGKSIVLLSLQTVGDYDPGIWLAPANKLHRFSPMFDEDEQPFKGNRKAFDLSDNDQTLWLAFVLAPGTYSITGFRDQVETRDGAVLFGRPPTRTTDLSKAGGPLTYEVGSGEIVYIGTFRSDVMRREADPIGRKFVDARKSYLLQTTEAKRMVENLSLPPATFKQVDVFAGRAEARTLYERAITTIPIDE